MDFYALLDQVIVLLHQRQRVTYRALKVHFQLDDEALDILKEELIDAQQLAKDEQGRMLVWTGGAVALPSPPPALQEMTPPQRPLDLLRLPPLTPNGVSSP